MHIDPKSLVPIFRQIADQLRQAIDAGVYKPGEMLPSLRSLAVDIRVNPNTVQRAYETLEREGVVETRRGIGIFVMKNSRQRMNAAEERLQERFQSTIRQGFRAGLTVDSVRATFESAMRHMLDEAKK